MTQTFSNMMYLSTSVKAWFCVLPVKTNFNISSSKGIFNCSLSNCQTQNAIGRKNKKQRKMSATHTKQLTPVQFVSAGVVKHCVRSKTKAIERSTSFKQIFTICIKEECCSRQASLAGMHSLSLGNKWFIFVYNSLLLRNRKSGNSKTYLCGGRNIKWPLATFNAKRQCQQKTKPKPNRPNTHTRIYSHTTVTAHLV